MPREREFSVEEALEDAANVFTRHGYAGTSMAMLLNETGLAKQSLYNAFGDKAQLYVKAIDCAVARFRTVSVRMGGLNGREAISIFFESLVADCTSGDPTRSHCIVSAGLLEGIEETTVQATLQARWRSSHELLRATVERGQRDGTVRAAAPSAELADLLMSLMSGLRVTARVELSAERLRAVVQRATAVLDYP